MQWILFACFFASVITASASPLPTASWYGDECKGRPMANGRPFNPRALTAASWAYPLGTRVTVSRPGLPLSSVTVTITDRGPARRLVHQGRVIDLSHAAFSRLAHPDLGLARVTVTPCR